MGQALRYLVALALFLTTTFSFADPPNSSAPTTADIKAYEAWAKDVKSLFRALQQLDALLKDSGLEMPPEEWNKIFTEKILPQLHTTPALIVAITGGTNLGKSTMFNHIVREYLSSVSASAGHTTLPTMAVSPQIEKKLIEELFKEFEITTEGSPQDAAASVGEMKKILLRFSDLIKQGIIVTDTPDYDSINENNWERAKMIARNSDVIVAMITGEKYKDKPVIDFYRKMKEADKPFVLVVNKVTKEQMELGHHNNWIQEFCELTGIKPEKIFVVENSVKDSLEDKMKFYSYDFGSQTLENAGSLRHYLSNLKDGELRRLAQLGAVKSANTGIRSFLTRTEERSKAFATLLAAIKDNKATEDLEWPGLPKIIFAKLVSTWWGQHRDMWTKFTTAVSSVFDKAIDGFVAMGKTWAGSDPTQTLDYESKYRLEQDDAIDKIIKDVFKRFQAIYQTNKHLLSPEAQKVFDPLAISSMISEIKAAHRVDHSLDAAKEMILNKYLPEFIKDEGTLAKLQTADFLAYGVLKPFVTVLPFGLFSGVLGKGLMTLLEVPVISKLVGMVDKAATLQSVDTLYAQVLKEYAIANQLWVLDQIWLKFGPVIQELEKGQQIVTDPAFAEALTCSERLSNPANYAIQ